MGHDDRHVGAADGDDQQEAERQGHADQQPERRVALVDHQPGDQQRDGDAERGIQLMLERKVMGAPLISACSLAKAMIEPLKVMPPTAMPMPISIRLEVWMSSAVPMP